MVFFFVPFSKDNNFDEFIVFLWYNFIFVYVQKVVKYKVQLTITTITN